MKKIIALILLVLLCVDTVITCAETTNDEKKQYDLFSFAHLQSHKFQELMDEIVAQSETWTSWFIIRRCCFPWRNAGTTWIPKWR